MKKASLTISAILLSLFLVLPSMSFAHDDEHEKDHGKESKKHQEYEEGSGSSEVESSHKGKEYEADHEEAEEEGSFSYKRHRKEMKEKKAMEKMLPKEEGSGSR